jgi:hypothetical protein
VMTRDWLGLHASLYLLGSIKNFSPVAFFA